MHHVQRVEQSLGGEYLRGHLSGSFNSASLLRAELTSGLSLVGRFPQPLFEFLQVFSDGGDCPPEHAAASLRLRVRQSLFSDDNKAESLLRLARRLFCGDGVRAFLDGLRCFTLAESLGGVESLVAHPATMTHAAMSPEARAAAGIGEGLLRLSVGIEHGGDLCRDVRDALDRVAALAGPPARRAAEAIA